jgi:hypothetical protein
VDDDWVDKSGHQQGVAQVGVEVEALHRQVGGRAGQSMRPTCEIMCETNMRETHQG